MIFIFTIILSIKCYAQVLKPIDIDLKPISKLAVSHLNEIPLNTEDLKNQIERLNKNFKLVDQATRSEILEIAITNKLLLNSHIKSGVKNLTTSLIKQAQEKLKKNSTILTSFSKEVMNKIIDDYLEYFQEGFLNRYQSFSRNDPKEVRKYRQLKSKLKLTSSWIHSFIDLNAKEFNTLCSKIIIEALELSVDESYYLGQFTKQISVDSASFELVIKKTDTTVPVKNETLKGAVETIDSDLLESASQEIDSIQTEK